MVDQRAAHPRPIRQGGGGRRTGVCASTDDNAAGRDAGGREPARGLSTGSKAVWADGRYRNSGKWIDHEGKEFTPKQHYYVGGNTKVYGAILFRFRERDFRAIQHVDGISAAWPLDYTDFEPYYSRAEQLYQVHGERGVDPLDPPSGTPYPFPAISHEPRIAQLSDDLAGA